MDLKILRFYGYFVEKMIQNPKEKECFRKVVILFYLEDHTISINEPVIHNSGMMQGAFLKRQKVPKNLDYKDFISFNDFKIGQKIEIFKTSIHIYDCDKCTRSWYDL